MEHLCLRHPTPEERASIVIWDSCACRPSSSKRNEIIECAEYFGFRTRLTGIHGARDGVRDFFKITADDEYDYLITNPPFSRGEEALRVAKSTDKPYALMFGGNRR